MMLLAACYGPTPVVVKQELRSPTGPSEPYALVVTVENQSGGAGQAEITARLRSKGTGATAAQADETVELQPHETVQVVLDLRPAAPGDYDAEVEAEYPPE
jgi:hypothetical protein